jgi:hypothetical protein
VATSTGQAVSLVWPHWRVRQGRAGFDPPRRSPGVMAPPFTYRGDRHGLATMTLPAESTIRTFMMWVEANS